MKLPPDKYRKLRKEACKRALNHCENCFMYCPLSVGQLDHIKTRGSGGSDTLENCVWLCWKCHTLRHTMGVKTFYGSKA